MLRKYILALAGFVGDELKGAVSPIAPYLRQIAIGTVIIIVSSGLWLVGLIWISIGVFMALAQQSTYMGPAFWCGGFSLALAVLATIIGLQMVRPPRR